MNPDPTCTECEGPLEVQDKSDHHGGAGGVATRCMNPECNRFQRLFCGECDAVMIYHPDGWLCEVCKAA